jgi:hypothetical protein
VRFVVKKKVMRPVFLPVFPFSSISIVNPPVINAHYYYSHQKDKRAKPQYGKTKSVGYRGLDGHNRAFILYSCFKQKQYEYATSPCKLNMGLHAREKSASIK